MTEVLVSEAGVATGVKVATRKGESVVVRATKAVVCNADLWPGAVLKPKEGWGLVFFAVFSVSFLFAVFNLWFFCCDLFLPVFLFFVQCEI